MRIFLIITLLVPLISVSQYCEPTQGKPAVEPVIDRVSIGSIDNDNSGFALTPSGYSDYTSMTTAMEVGSTQSITIETGDFFPHNIGIWIDYNRDQVFSEEENIATFAIGGMDPMSQTIEFEVPEGAVVGPTRMRVRGMLEPFGPWSLSMDPCLPVDGDGEIEDYAVAIVGGYEASVGLVELMHPQSDVDLGVENVQVRLRNHGPMAATDIELTLWVGGESMVTETISETLESQASLEYTFSQGVDFSGLECEEVSVSVNWGNDQIDADNQLTRNVCNLEANTGSNVWYLHSNVNGGIEPLGGEPFNSTSNVETMNTVFGEGGWQQEFFETADASSVFSENSCVVFLDGSYDHSMPFETFLSDNLQAMENWVAAGGKLFLNYSKESGEHFYTLVGFGNTMISIYAAVSAAPETGHPLLEGPYQPLADDYSGFYFAQTSISGTGLEKILYETNNEGFGGAVLHLPLLAEKEWGQGKVIFGGIAPGQLVTPAAEAMNLRANVLDYLHECEVSSDVISSDEIADILVYPNPATDVLNIPGNWDNNDQLRIFNAAGQVVCSQSAANTLDISSWSDGLYFLEISSFETVHRAKIIKH